MYFILANAFSEKIIELLYFYCYTLKHVKSFTTRQELCCPRYKPLAIWLFKYKGFFFKKLKFYIDNQSPFNFLDNHTKPVATLSDSAV